MGQLNMTEGKETGLLSKKVLNAKYKCYGVLENIFGLLNQS